MAFSATSMLSIATPENLIHLAKIIDSISAGSNFPENDLHALVVDLKAFIETIEEENAAQYYLTIDQLFSSDASAPNQWQAIIDILESNGSVTSELWVTIIHGYRYLSEKNSEAELANQLSKIMCIPEMLTKLKARQLESTPEEGKPYRIYLLTILKKLLAEEQNSNRLLLRCIGEIYVSDFANNKPEDRDIFDDIKTSIQAEITALQVAGKTNQEIIRELCDLNQIIDSLYELSINPYGDNTKELYQVVLKIFILNTTLAALCQQDDKAEQNQQEEQAHYDPDKLAKTLGDLLDSCNNTNLSKIAQIATNIDRYNIASGGEYAHSFAFFSTILKAHATPKAVEEAKEEERYQASSPESTGSKGRPSPRRRSFVDMAGSALTGLAARRRSSLSSLRYKKHDLSDDLVHVFISLLTSKQLDQEFVDDIIDRLYSFVQSANKDTDVDLSTIQYIFADSNYTTCKFMLDRLKLDTTKEGTYWRVLVDAILATKHPAALARIVKHCSIMALASLPTSQEQQANVKNSTLSDNLKNTYPIFIEYTPFLEYLTSQVTRLLKDDGNFTTHATDQQYDEREPDIYYNLMVKHGRSFYTKFTGYLTQLGNYSDVAAAYSKLFFEYGQLNKLFIILFGCNNTRLVKRLNHTTRNEIISRFEHLFVPFYYQELNDLSWIRGQGIFGGFIQTAAVSRVKIKVFNEIIEDMVNPSQLIDDLYEYINENEENYSVGLHDFSLKFYQLVMILTLKLENSVQHVAADDLVAELERIFNKADQTKINAIAAKFDVDENFGVGGNDEIACAFMQCAVAICAAASNPAGDEAQQLATALAEQHQEAFAVTEEESERISIAQQIPVARSSTGNEKITGAEPLATPAQEEQKAVQLAEPTSPPNYSS